MAAVSPEVTVADARAGVAVAVRCVGDGVERAGVPVGAGSDAATSMSLSPPVRSCSGPLHAATTAATTPANDDNSVRRVMFRRM